MTTSATYEERLVQIGVGEHTPHTLSRVFVDRIPTIRELRFVDLSAERLEAVEATCRALVRETGIDVKVTCSTDYQAALQDATMVTFSFGVGYPQLVLEDYARAEKHGISMVEGETIGIGGGLMGLRHLKAAMPMIDAMARICPESWCLISTNPIRHLTDYAARYAKLPRTMGHCHGVVATLEYLEKAIGLPPKTLDCQVAGANHHFWFLKIWNRVTGEDYQPELARILRDRPLDGEMGRALYPIFGLYPGNGPDHVPDAFGFFPRETWARYDIHQCVTQHHADPLADGGKNAPDDGRKPWTAGMRNVRDGKLTAQEYLERLSEAAAHDPNAVVHRSLFQTDSLHYHPALNIPNRGAVSNLPEDAIVEVPGVCNRIGAYPLTVGPLPDAVAELVRRQVTIQKLQVDAAATGSRQKLLQSLLLDPTIKNIDSALAFMDETLRDRGSYYPAFN